MNSSPAYRLGLNTGSVILARLIRSLRSASGLDLTPSHISPTATRNSADPWTGPARNSAASWSGWHFPCWTTRSEERRVGIVERTCEVIVMEEHEARRVH